MPKLPATVLPGSNSVYLDCICRGNTILCAAESIELSPDEAVAVDVNRNGSVTLTDTSYILEAAVDLLVPPCPGAGIIGDFDPPERVFCRKRRKFTEPTGGIGAFCRRGLDATEPESRMSLVSLRAGMIQADWPRRVPPAACRQCRGNHVRISRPWHLTFSETALSRWRWTMRTFIPRRMHVVNKVR